MNKQDKLFYGDISKAQARDKLKQVIRKEKIVHFFGDIAITQVGRNSSLFCFYEFRGDNWVYVSLLTANDLFKIALKQEEERKRAKND